MLKFRCFLHEDSHLSFPIIYLITSCVLSLMNTISLRLSLSSSNTSYTRSLFARVLIKIESPDIATRAISSRSSSAYYQGISTCQAVNIKLCKVVLRYLSARHSVQGMRCGLWNVTARSSKRSESGFAPARNISSEGHRRRKEEMLDS